METLKYKVLNPIEFSGWADGDYGYEIEGVKSDKSYVSSAGAKKAMYLRLRKMYE